MTTAKYQAAPRRSAAPAARQAKKPAPALVAGRIPLAPVPAAPPPSLSELLPDFTRVDSLLAGADALLGLPAPPCPGIEPVRRALAQAAGLADEARDRVDDCALGNFGDSASPYDALRVLALQVDGTGALLVAAGNLLEATPWENSLPLVRVFPLLEIAREHCEAIAARLRVAMRASYSDQVAA